MKKRIKTFIDENEGQFPPYVVLEQDPKGVVLGMNGTGEIITRLIATCLRRSPQFNDAVRAAVVIVDFMNTNDGKLFNPKTQTDDKSEKDPRGNGGNLSPAGKP